jgi:hypothetical protein
VFLSVIFLFVTHVFMHFAAICTAENFSQLKFDYLFCASRMSTLSFVIHSAILF